MVSLDPTQIQALASQVVGDGEANLICSGLDGRLRYANQSACDRIGYALTELTSKKVFDISPYETEDLYQGHCNRVLARGKDRIYSYHKSCNGTIYPVEIVSLPHTIKTTQEQLMLSVIQEVQQSQRYMHMLETTEHAQRTGSFDYNLQDQSILVSDNLLAIMGTEDPRELRPASMVDRLNKQGVERWNGKMLGFLNGHHRMDEEFLMQTADNRQSMVRVVMWSTLSEGKVSGITGYYQVVEEPDMGNFLTLEENQRRHIIKALSYTNGRVTGPNGAEHLLGINGKTLFARMKKLNIDRNDYKAHS